MAHHPPKPSEDRSTVINFRAPKQQRDLLDRAARITGKTRTEFILEASCRAAEDVLLDQRLFALDDQRYQAFVEVLDAPPDANPQLQTLMKKPAPWR